MNELDALLQTPLTDIADNGFSARVLLRIEKRRLRRQALILAACPLAALALLPVLLLPGIDTDSLRMLFFGFGDPTGQLSITLMRIGHIVQQPGTLILAAVLVFVLRADRAWARR